MKDSEDHAIRGMILVARLAGAAQYFIKHDQFETSEKYLKAVREGVSELEKLYPGSSESAVSRRTYDIVKREYEVASAS